MVWQSDVAGLYSWMSAGLHSGLLCWCVKCIRFVVGWYAGQVGEELVVCMCFGCE